MTKNFAEPALFVKFNAVDIVFGFITPRIAGIRVGCNTTRVTRLLRFVVRADEKLTAFLELESAVRTCAELS